MIALDTRGMRCPWPALRLARALRDHGAPVEIWADDPAARRELTAVATAAGCDLKPLAGDRFRIESCREINRVFTRGA